MTPKRIVRSVIALFILVGGFLVWERLGAPVPFQASNAPAKAGAAASPVPVSVASVRQADFPVKLEGLGQVQAFNTVTIHAQVNGQVDKVFFKEGALVKQNDLLVQIDPAPFQAALDQANGKLAQDQANLQNANLDLQRYQTLAKQDFASAQQLDTQQAVVRQDTALIQSDQAAVSAAQIPLGYTQIRAPIAGRVGFRLVDPGNIVHTTDPNGILSITQIQPIFVAFTAPGDDVDRINKALQAGAVKVTALSDDGQRTLAKGTLTVINNQIDVTTATIQLKATFANQDNALWPGLSVETQTQIDTLKNVLVVPTGAVQHGPNGLFAYVVTKDNKATVRPIDVSAESGGVSVVTKGLTAGESVVTDGQFKLQDGSPVTTEVAQNNAAEGQAQ